MGMMVDEKYGGSGMDTISYVLAMEEISKVDASVSVYERQQLPCMLRPPGLGTEEQREKYLRPWHPKDWSILPQS